MTLSLFGPDEPTTIDAISLWQPWASLCFAADINVRKVDETRHWSYPEMLLGATVCIHAALYFPAKLEPALDALCVRAFGAGYRDRLPRGALIGTVRLGQCRPTVIARLNSSSANIIAGNFDEFSEVKGVLKRRYAWALDHPTPLPKPIAEKGRQGWWRVARARVLG